MRVNVWAVLVAFWERSPGLVRGSPYFEALFVHNVIFIMSIILIRQSHILPQIFIIMYCRFFNSAPERNRICVK